MDSIDALDELSRAAPHGDDTVMPRGIARTGRGWHIYLTPTRMGNRAGVLPGVDFRGAGGYVIAPPSTHPNGNRYAWLATEPDGRLTPASGPAELDPAPSWLADLRHPRRRRRCPWVHHGPVRVAGTGNGLSRRNADGWHLRRKDNATTS